jgi:hypothetical protein
MSQENVEFLRNLFAGAEALDKEAMLAALPDLIAATCDPEIEWVEDPQRADGRVYRGHDGVRESWKRWLENSRSMASRWSTDEVARAAPM